MAPLGLYARKCLPVVFVWQETAGSGDEHWQPMRVMSILSKEPTSGHHGRQAT